jgi:hypothetical protein
MMGPEAGRRKGMPPRPAAQQDSKTGGMHGHCDRDQNEGDEAYGNHDQGLLSSGLVGTALLPQSAHAPHFQGETLNSITAKV